MLKSEKSIGIVPVFVSHMGCPNDCTFCNQRKITGHNEAISPDALFAYVMRYIETMKRDQIELAFFGGSFTGIDADLQERYLSVAYKLKMSGLIHKIRLSTRPDYMDDQIAARLKVYLVDLVELGCQSFDDEVLSLSKRGHLSYDIYSAVSVLKRHEIEFGIQLMLGLPGDDFEKFMSAVSMTIELKPSCVRLYPALVIKQTELEEQYHQGIYKPLSLEEAVSWTAEALILFEQHDVNVIRIGLQRTDLIDFGGDVVEGPFHPAFGELVRSRIVLKAMMNLINEHDDIIRQMIYHERVDVIIKVNVRQTSMAIGNKGCNRLALSTTLKAMYPGHEVRLEIMGCPELSVGTLQLRVGDYSINKEIYK